MRHHRSLQLKFLSGLIAYWSFNGDVQDYAGDNDGTINGDPQFVEGVSGQALEFDGVDDYVETTEVDAFNYTSEPFTISAYVKRNTDGERHTIIGNREDNNGYHFRIESGNILTLAIVGQSQNIVGSSTIQSDVWYHCAVVHKGNGSFKLFLNGELENSDTINEIVSSEGPLRIGAVDVGDYMDGLIDEPRIYNRALSEDEIEYLHNNPGL